MSQKHMKTAAIVFLGVAALYYYQAKKAGFNPSLSTSLKWPLYAITSPVSMISILTGTAQATA